MSIEAYKQQTFSTQGAENMTAGIQTFSGKQVLQLPEVVRRSYVGQIVEKLASKPNTMLQWPAEELLTSMEEGRSALIVDQVTRQLLAFSQVWPYQYDLKLYLRPESRDFFDHAKQVLEVGTWLSFARENSIPGVAPRGYGRRVLQEAVAAGRAYDSQALSIAIVEQNNVRAQGIILDLGGRYIGEKISPTIRDANGTSAEMRIFDVSDI